MRKLGIINWILEEEKDNEKLQTLRKDYTLRAITFTAKELLDDRIFESHTRAKRRHPEWFQSSETQKAEKQVSEAAVVRSEAEVAHDSEVTSYDKKDDECIDPEQVQRRAKSEGISKKNAEALNKPLIRRVYYDLQHDEPGLEQHMRGDGHVANLLDSTETTSKVRSKLSIPTLYPVYLPFKTQRRIILLVQNLLEECCLDVGNTLVPDIMERQQWHEAGSFELNRWTSRFQFEPRLRSFMKPIPGKTTEEILNGAVPIRHAAVHREQNSAVDMLNKLGAAITFAEALHDSKRAEKLAKIKTKLEASRKEIVQHQNLLERKCVDQLMEIELHRARLDELEESAIEDMRVTDKEQRTKIGSAFESFLAGSEQVSDPYPCDYTPSSDTPKVDFEAGWNVATSGISMFPCGPFFHFKSGRFLYSFLTVPVEQEQSSPNETLKAQASSSSSLDDEAYDGMTHGANFEYPQQKDVPAESCITVEESSPAENPCVVASEEDLSTDESFNVVSEVELLPEDALSAETVSTEDPLIKESVGDSFTDESYIVAPEEESLPEETFLTKAVPAEDPLEKKSDDPNSTRATHRSAKVVEFLDNVRQRYLN